MELNDNAAVRADPINPQAGEGSAAEIELYDELIAFAELPPEEQARLESSPSQAPAGSANDAQECLALAHPLAGSGLFVAEADAPSVEPTDHTSPEELLPTVNAVDPETTVSPQSECDSEFLGESRETIDDSKPLVEGPGPSGPLSGFNLPQEMVYTGALSRGVCLACGAESGADDLFCLTCGDFIDEVGSTLPSSPTCGECQQPIDAGEIFCPWCGSATVAQR